MIVAKALGDAHMFPWWKYESGKCPPTRSTEADALEHYSLYTEIGLPNYFFRKCFALVWLLSDEI